MSRCIMKKDRGRAMCAESSPFAGVVCAAIVMMATVMPAVAATVVAREPLTLRIGERVRVDDGSCPTGQIREVVGVSGQGAAPTRIGRQSHCVPRKR